MPRPILKFIFILFHFFVLTYISINMQSSSIDFLFEKINKISFPTIKITPYLENHIGPSNN